MRFPPSGPRRHDLTVAYCCSREEPGRRRRTSISSSHSISTNGFRERLAASDGFLQVGLDLGSLAAFRKEPQIQAGSSGGPSRRVPGRTGGAHGVGRRRVMHVQPRSGGRHTIALQPNVIARRIGSAAKRPAVTVPKFTIPMNSLRSLVHAGALLAIVRTALVDSEISRHVRFWRLFRRGPGWKGPP